ncbi:gamma-glutamyl carboxylase [Tachypleus tridentatus]|uniref:gamma-glutamyl carboxylase n=1 Tax=Tachypleus tridentatus TaxID=6853 RepID=UPI003FD6771E
MEKTLGFGWSDISSFNAILRLLHRPTDPASLGVTRFLFGLMMIMDIPNERGLANADIMWGDPWKCRFPLFNILRPLPLEWMYVIYFIMLIGAIGIMLGVFYRLSCVCFILPYWYLFVLEKSRWNNHSYLYGLLGMIFLVCDGHRYCSVDGLFKRKIKNSQVPLWNYILLRGQIFLVYFIAGLKKTDKDWVGGYSMKYLSAHWVFDIFKFILEKEQIDYFIVHWGGFLLDLTIGFFLFLDSSRPVAFIFCGAFHLMNSRMFSIGMFPYVMLATMPIFCSPDWPRPFISSSPAFLKCCLPVNEPHSGILIVHTITESSVSVWHKAVVVGLCGYFAVQAFLPYSHWLTKGYNTWTQGLYGYSWDMMVHNWKHLHTKVTVVESRTGQELYLDSEAWTHSWRWTHHADMVKQFASCVANRLESQYNITNIEIYVDVWLSLNGRFSQRVYDPTVNILEADWSPFREITWVLPVLTELSDWRAVLRDVENSLEKESQHVDVVFLADFPGLSLLNFIEKDLSNATLKALKGIIEVIIPQEGVIILQEGSSLQIPTGKYHQVSPLKHSPACYMYTFVNQTEQKLESAWIENKENRTKLYPKIPNRRKDIYFQLKEQEESQNKLTVFENYQEVFLHKINLWYKSLIMIVKALQSIITGIPLIVPSSKQTSAFS